MWSQPMAACSRQMLNRMKTSSGVRVAVVAIWVTSIEYRLHRKVECGIAKSERYPARQLLPSCSHRAALRTWEESECWMCDPTTEQLLVRTRGMRSLVMRMSCE